MGCQRHAPTNLPPEHTIRIVQESGCDPGPVWILTENFANTGIRFLDRPARCESLYCLRYTGPTWYISGLLDITKIYSCNKKYVHLFTRHYQYSRTGWKLEEGIIIRFIIPVVSYKLLVLPTVEHKYLVVEVCYFYISMNYMFRRLCPSSGWMNWQKHRRLHLACILFTLGGGVIGWGYEISCVLSREEGIWVLLC